MWGMRAEKSTDICFVLVHPIIKVVLSVNGRLIFIPEAVCLYHMTSVYAELRRFRNDS